MRFMNVKQIAQKAGVSTRRVYYVKDKIGHLPTVQEVKDYKPIRPNHRPPVYKLDNSETEI